MPWKPLGTRPLGFHQDNSYLDFVVTGEMATHRRNSSPVRIVIELRIKGTPYLILTFACDTELSKVSP